MKQPRKPRLTGDHTMTRRVSAMDMAAELEDMLPGLRSALRQGLSAEDIYKEFTAMAAARGVHIALTDRDTSRALSAIKDILDRTGGKAKEQVEHKHRLESLPDEQLDALLKTKIQDATSKQKH